MFLTPITSYSGTSIYIIEAKFCLYIQSFELENRIKMKRGC